MPLLSYQVNIYEYPKQIESPTNQQLTIGDLHANTMKLMYFLIQQGIVTNFDANDYQKMLGIYQKKAASLREEHIKAYDNLIEKLEFRTDTLVRLIGDELADRGSNDYFTLKILEKMHAQHVPMEIIFSNHGLEFLRACKNASKGKGFKELQIANSATLSIDSLNVLAEKNIVKKEDIFRISKIAYEPNLRAISYSINPKSDQITIFSHAPIGLDTIKALARQFKVDYKDSTREELAQTIDLINGEFQKTANLTTNIFEDSVVEEKVALGVTIWNRRYENLNRPQKHNGFNLAWVHGHDADDNDAKVSSHITNLDSDNVLGKSPNSNQGRLKVLGEGLRILSLKTLNEIQTLERTLKTNHYDKAANIAQTLHQELVQAMEKFNQSEDLNGRLSCFQEACNKAISQARPELKNHRGWREIVTNIILLVSILSIVGILIAWPELSCRWRSGSHHFSVFKTYSELKLDELVKELETLQNELEPPEVQSSLTSPSP